jgi:hypothetical protein
MSGHCGSGAGGTRTAGRWWLAYVLTSLHPRRWRR